MNILGIPILSFVVFFPLAGALVLALIPRKSEETVKYVAFGISLIEFFASLPLLYRFQPYTAGEIGRLRRSPLVDVEKARASLLKAMDDRRD